MMRFRPFASAALFASSVGFSVPAMASADLGKTACAPTDLSAFVSSCSGWYEGNLNSSKPASVKDAEKILNTLVRNTSNGFSTDWVEDFVAKSGNTIDFKTPLFGMTVISIHAGAAKGSNGVGYQGTAYYIFDAGNIAGGLDTLTFNRGGLSNARLYSTGTYQTPNTPPAVPEPESWAMLIGGFFVGGAMLRRRRAATLRFGLATDRPGVRLTDCASASALP
jgi:hypothetical protein